MNTKGKANSLSNYFFSLSLNSRLDIHKEGTDHLLSLKVDMSYSCFIDSIWVKNEDAFFLSYIRMQSIRGIAKSSVLFSLKTQFTDSWDTFLNTRRWTGGPFTPGIFTFGYGIAYVFKKNGSLNIGIASIKINSFNTDLERFYKIQFRSKKVGIHYDFGTTVQFLYNQNVFSFLNYECRWNVFINGFKKEQLNLDLQSRVTFKIIGFFRIRLGVNILYDPIQKSGFFNKREILAGFFF